MRVESSSGQRQAATGAMDHGGGFCNTTNTSPAIARDHFGARHRTRKPKQRVFPPAVVIAVKFAGRLFNLPSATGTEDVDLSVYELAYSATALATSSVEALPPSPRRVRVAGGDRTCLGDEPCQNQSHIIKWRSLQSPSPRLTWKRCHPCRRCALCLRRSRAQWPIPNVSPFRFL